MFSNDQYFQPQLLNETLREWRQEVLLESIDIIINLNHLGCIVYINLNLKSYAHEPQMKNGKVLGRDECLFRCQLKFMFINRHQSADQGHRGGFGEMESSKRSWSETGLP